MKKVQFYILCFCLAISASVNAQSIPEGILGDWSLDVESGIPGWMSVQEKDGKPIVYFRLYVGSSGPFENVELVDDRLKFALRKRKSKKKANRSQPNDRCRHERR